MLQFFDNLFYQVCKVYSKTKDSSPELAGVCVVAIMQAFNIYAVIIVYGMVVQNKSIFSKYLVVVSYTVLIVYNYLRFIYNDNHNYKILKTKFINKTGISALVYVLISTILFLLLVIYAGSKKY
jgi:hypothetical protein